MTATIEELQERLSRVEAAVARLEGRIERAARIGKSVDQVRHTLEAHPQQEWTDEMWDDLLRLAGIMEGPADLAENFRRYLHDDSA